MKTLMIGLGGTGCTVVSRVKQRVGTKDPMIQFLGFDTDTNQDESQGLTVIQTSRDATVGELLRSERGWQEWFPDNNMLRARDVTQGAGQCRVLSRLAFSDTVRRRAALTELDAAIRQLSLEQGQVKAEPLKVVIVSSFAGGTGSGSFIQVPLFLRKYLQNKYQLSNIRIRGLFALPDVFQSVQSSDIQEESMYANAYASLRELSAINAICLSANPEVNKYQIKIGDLFDSKKLRSRHNADNPAITTAGVKPYDFIFFVDDVNRNNRILGSHKDYINLMAEIAYMQAYSPLVKKTMSREDNLINTMMLTDGESMYGSAGCAKLVYPYDDVVEYCALRAAADIIDEKWTVIEAKFKARYQEAKAQRVNDPTITLPDRGDTFVEEVDNYLKNKNAKFAFLRDGVKTTQTVTTTDKKGKENKREEEIFRHDLFIDAVDTYIENVLAKDPSIDADSKGCDVNFDEISLLDIDMAKNIIEDAEVAANTYYNTIIDRTNTLTRNIVGAIIPESLGGLDDDLSCDYNIRNLLEKASKRGRYAVHPLAARYMLYRLRRHFGDQQEELEKDITVQNGAIKKFLEYDWNPKTDERDAPQDAVPKMPLSRRRYKNDYADQYKKTVNTLRSFARNRLKEGVYRGLIARLDALNEQYERLFDCLDTVTNGLVLRSTRLEEKYQKDSASATYLCASPRDLHITYAGLPIDDDSADQNGIYDSVFSTVYNSALEEMRVRAENSAYSLETDEEAEKRKLRISITSLFDNQVVPYYQQQLRKTGGSDLNMSVYQALEKQVVKTLEAEAEAQNRMPDLSTAERSRIRDQILSSVAQKAAPYLSNRGYHEVNTEVGADTGFSHEIDSLFWGINDDVNADIARDFGQPATYFRTIGQLESDLTASPMYSAYEFSCYRALYSVSLSEIPKFREDEDEKGRFYSFYESRINKMLAGRYGQTDEGVTPHLDIRWHSRQYLPMISHEKNDRDDRDAARALWLGLFYKLIRDEYNKKQMRHQVFAYFTARNENTSADIMRYPARVLSYNGKDVQISQIYEMFKALQQDSLSTRHLLEVLEPRLEKDSRLETYDFIGDRANPLAMAMIDEKRAQNAPAPAVVGDDQEEEEAELVTGRNALVLMSRIINHRQATQAEKQLLMEELWKIIGQLTEEMSEDRTNELLTRIFVNSPYVREAQRQGASIALYPYFSQVIDQYDKQKTPRRAAKK